MKRRGFLIVATGISALARPNVVRAQGTAGAISVLRFVPQSDLTLLDPVFNTALVTRNHGMMATAATMPRAGFAETRPLTPSR